ncbi:MAG: hypothetical protein WCQ21_04315 [Verrucomicrobiota bacterium]|jgi:hypothetical protein
MIWPGAPASARKSVFQSWKDSQAHSVSFCQWSHQMEQDLQIATALGALDERKSLGKCDTFEFFEKFTLHQLCQSFASGASATDLRAVVQSRRASFWQPQHQPVASTGPTCTRDTCESMARCMASARAATWLWTW